MEREEIIRWLKEEDYWKLNELYKKADALRSQMLGATACVHGLIEFSNCCSGGKTDGTGCLYCGLRAGNKTLTRYRLIKDEGRKICVGWGRNKKELTGKEFNEGFCTVDH